MMLKNCFVLMCVVILLQLGNIHSTEFSRMKRDESDRYITTRTHRTAKITQGQEINYSCSIAVGKSEPNTTLIYQQKSRNSESWGPVLGGIQPHRYVEEKIRAYADLKFKADFNLHNGSSFRCLVKENSTYPKPCQFHMIVVHETDHSTTDLPKTKSDPYHRTIKDRSTTDQTTTDQTTIDRTILYFACGATGFILIVIIAVVIICVIVIIRRCRRRSSVEGHVDTSTQPQQLETGEGHVNTSTRPLQLESRNDELYIYEDPDDYRNSDNFSKRKLLRNAETRLQHNTQSHKAMRGEKGEDSTSYIDMEAEKGRDITPYMDMTAEKGRDTTPYMDMTAVKGEDTTPYMDMEAGKDTDTTPYMNIEAGKAASLKEETVHT
ncbi:uncharacterized protein LOC141907410 [Tubulanus polymorphus]|uniref:uncharacterized protein LOC141907410 n=1 Tax=Tubulanus polymorphus TaxID=672921 RepID=UPI003DA30545